MTSYDLVGNIAIVKFPREFKKKEKKKFGEKLLKQHKNVKTVLEKSGKFSGRLRTLKTRYVAGEKNKEVLYKENGCVFRFNVDTCYFSPRLSTEREEIAKQVKRGEKVLVMFGGVGFYGIVIGKNSKIGKNGKIVSVELSRECNKYALENAKRNKVSIEIVRGDVRKKVPFLKLSANSRGGRDSKFDRIVMPRPNLKDSFLDVAFSAIKKGGVIHYYGFYHEMEFKAGVLEELIDFEARKAKKKVKILGVKRAGDIAPYKYRYRIDLKVLN